MIHPGGGAGRGGGGLRAGGEGGLLGGGGRFGGLLDRLLHLCPPHVHHPVRLGLGAGVEGLGLALPLAALLVVQHRPTAFMRCLPPLDAPRRVLHKTSNGCQHGCQMGAKSKSEPMVTRCIRLYSITISEGYNHRYNYMRRCKTNTCTSMFVYLAESSRKAGVIGSSPITGSREIAGHRGNPVTCFSLGAKWVPTWVPNLGSPSHENAAVPLGERRHVWRHCVLADGAAPSLLSRWRFPTDQGS